MRRFGSVSAFPLVFAVGVALAAQDQGARLPEVSRQSPTFRSGTSLVALNVTVMEAGKLVTGLAREQFEVYEDGVPQDVRFFESTNVPLDVILLLDTSASMRHQMPVVHDAARAFMKILRRGDRGAVVAFNDHVRILQGLTEDPGAIEAAIGSAEGSGSTALYTAVYVALKEFGRSAVSAERVRRQAIAVLSDGEDTSSLVSFNDVVATARSAGVTIYTIGLQPEAGEVRGAGFRSRVSESTYALKQLARETGARAFFPAGAHALKDVYADISAELEAQYSIAYAPTNGRSDGRFRKVIVRIPENPQFQARTRTGYTADPPRGTIVGDTPFR